MCGKYLHSSYSSSVSDNIINFYRGHFYYSAKWKANEFSRGSYTAIGVGSSQLDIEHIARPIHVNNNKIVSNRYPNMCL